MCIYIYICIHTHARTHTRTHARTHTHTLFLRCESILVAVQQFVVVEMIVDPVDEEFFQKFASCVYQTNWSVFVYFS